MNSKDDDRDIRDRLIKLEELVRIKVSEMSEVPSQIASLDARVRAQEDLALKYNGAELIPEFKEMSRWVADFRTRIRSYAIFGTIILAVVASVLARIINHVLGL